MSDLNMDNVVSAPMYVREGKIFFLFIYDIGHKIDLDKALNILNELEGATPEEILPRHIGSRLFKFTTGLPISWEGNVKNLYTFSQVTIEPRARFILWPNGYAGVEFSFDLSSQNNKMTLGKISHFLSVMRNNHTLREEAKIFVDSIIERVSISISDQHKPAYCEDYVSVAISSFSKNISEETLYNKYRSHIAHIVRQEKYGKGLHSLSKSQIEEVWRQSLSYLRGELIIVTFDVAFLYGENNDDEKRLVELINLHMIELKTLLKILTDKRKEFTIGHLQIPRNGRKRKRSKKIRVENLKSSIVDLKERADEVLSASQRSLQITQDPFLSSVYKTASRAFGLKSMRSQVETQLDSLTQTYEGLIEHKRHSSSYLLELLVAIMIAVEVIPPVCKWIGNMITVMGYDWILMNPFIETLKQIFVH